MKRFVVVAALLMVFGPTSLSSLAHAGDRHDGDRHDGDHHKGPRTIVTKGKFVGSGINNVALQEAGGTPVGQAVLTRTQAKGDGETSASDGLFQWDPAVYSYSPDCFEGGEGLIFPIVHVDYLTTFSDLSSYYGNLKEEGELCVNYYDFSQARYRYDVNVTGGTGRFAGATGVSEIRGSSQAMPPGRFSVSEGRTKTTLTLP